MSELQDAIDTLVDNDNLQEMTRHNAADFVKAIAALLDAARRVANGRPQAARELVDSEGERHWAVTVMVDGPGEYTLLDPPEET